MYFNVKNQINKVVIQTLLLEPKHASLLRKTKTEHNKKQPKYKTYDTLYW